MSKRLLLLAFSALLASPLHKLSAEELVYYTLPPEGSVAFRPMVYHENTLHDIEGVFRGYPTIRIEGKKKTLRGEFPTYVFVPVAEFSETSLIEFQGHHRDLIYDNQIGLRHTFTFDKDNPSVMGMMVVKYQESAREFFVPFKLGQVKADQPKKVHIPLPRPKEIEGRPTFNSDYYLYDQTGPILSGFNAEAAFAAEISSDAFYEAIVDANLDNGTGDSKLRVIHNPLPVIEKGSDAEATTTRFLFKTTFSKEGSVSRVEVDMEQGPEEVIKAAIQALFAWRTLPAVKDGRPIESEVMVPIELTY